MPSSHPYVLLRCDACGMLAEPSIAASARYDAHGAPAVDDAPSYLAGFDDDEHALAGSGLLIFARDGELRFEEPPLCSRCSVAIGVTALVRWAEEEEEG